MSEKQHVVTNDVSKFDWHTKKLAGNFSARWLIAFGNELKVANPCVMLGLWDYKF